MRFSKFMVLATIVGLCLQSCCGSPADTEPSQVKAKSGMDWRVGGIVLDTNGSPVRAQVASVNAHGSVSMGNQEDGAFSLIAISEAVTLHAETMDGQVAVLHDVPEGTVDATLRVAPGATLELFMQSNHDARCGLYSDGKKVHDFTLYPGKSATVVLPVGDAKVILYDGDTVYEERELVVHAGARIPVSFDITSP